jgi:hypothetical protein
MARARCARATAIASSLVRDGIAASGALVVSSMAFDAQWRCPRI